MFNGTYSKTCLVREKDDTFIPFNVDEVICINPRSIKDFMSIMEKKENVLVDSRLEYILLFAFLKYGLELLIYDSYNQNVYSIIEYFSTIMYIESTEISLLNIKKYCIGKLIVNYGFPNLKIRWIKDAAISAMHEKNLYSMKYDITYMILCVMGIKDYVKVSMDKVEKFNQLYKDILDIKDIAPIDDINENEFYSILCLIIDNR